MTLSRSSVSEELMAKHGRFTTQRITLCKCIHCPWESKAQTQGGATSAAKRHVERNPDHKVLTRRLQDKVTYMRKVTVLR